MGPRPAHKHTLSRASCQGVPKSVRRRREGRLVLCRSLDAMDPERPPPALVSDALEEIFLRVASPADLARAAAACVSFRGLISSSSFLRRYRSVHPPPLLGFIREDGLHPVEATHPSAAVSRGLARTVDLSFLPGGAQSWCVNDVRDGRVLVGRFRDRGAFTEYWYLAVCDPLFQRYLLLPPITHDLFASVGLHNNDSDCSGASLIPSGGTEEEEMSFSVICWMYSYTRFAVFIFSTKTGSAQWDAVKSISWADLGIPEEIDYDDLNQGQCVYGCYYWKLYGRKELLKLDMDTMEFSKYDCPPDHDERTIAIVESGEGKVGMFSKLHEGPVEYYTFMQNGTDKSHKWCLKSTIPLPIHGPSKYCFVVGQAEGYVFLVNHTGKINLECFSLEVKSYNIERACRTSGIERACRTCGRMFSLPYFAFPPFMSPRRIQGGHGESAWRLNANQKAIKYSIDQLDVVESQSYWIQIQGGHGEGHSPDQGGCQRYPEREGRGQGHGQVREDHIDRMVREAEEFAEEDKKVKERVDARNQLETYVYNTVGDKDKLADKLEAEEVLKEVLEWLDNNQSAEKEDYEEKLKEVEAVCNPIVSAVYQWSGGAHGGDSEGGVDDDHDEL